MNEEKPRKLSRLYFRQEQAVQQQSEGSTKKISRLVARQEESNSRLYFRQSGSEHLPASPIISGIDILTKQGVVDPTLGMTIVGQTGMGKSSLLQHIILSDIEAGVTNIVFDAHGDLTQDIVASLPLKFSKNMFVLAVDSDFAFGLNMYETTSRSPVARDRTVANVIDIFKKLWREERQFYPTLEHILRSTARMLLDNPDYSMAEIPKMFSNTKFRHHLLANVTNPAVHDFWQEYDSLRSFEQTQMLSSTRNRLNQFLSSELVQLIVSQ